MRGFVVLHAARNDDTPLDDTGRPVRLVAAQEGLKGERRLVRGAPILLRTDSISGVLPDRARPDGERTSIVQRLDGQGPMQTWETALEIAGKINADQTA